MKILTFEVIILKAISTSRNSKHSLHSYVFIQSIIVEFCLLWRINLAYYIIWWTTNLFTSQIKHILSFYSLKYFHIQIYSEYFFYFIDKFLNISKLLQYGKNHAPLKTFWGAILSTMLTQKGNPDELKRSTFLLTRHIHIRKKTFIFNKTQHWLNRLFICLHQDFLVCENIGERGNSSFWFSSILVLDPFFFFSGTIFHLGSLRPSVL